MLVSCAMITTLDEIKAILPDLDQPGVGSVNFPGTVHIIIGGRCDYQVSFSSSTSGSVSFAARF